MENEPSFERHLCISWLVSKSKAIVFPSPETKGVDISCIRKNVSTDRREQRNKHFGPFNRAQAGSENHGENDRQHLN